MEEKRKTEIKASGQRIWYVALELCWGRGNVSLGIGWTVMTFRGIVPLSTCVVTVLYAASVTVRYRTARLSHHEK